MFQSCREKIIHKHTYSRYIYVRNAYIYLKRLGFIDKDLKEFPFKNATIVYKVPVIFEVEQLSFGDNFCLCFNFLDSDYGDILYFCLKKGVESGTVKKIFDMISREVNSPYPEKLCDSCLLREFCEDNLKSCPKYVPTKED